MRVNVNALESLLMHVRMAVLRSVVVVVRVLVCDVRVLVGGVRMNVGLLPVLVFVCMRSVVGVFGHRYPPYDEMLCLATVSVT
ncbi:hypothetical protein BN971_02638 [Mycobacterium bohemicum DSM 44277]|uniref:Uncharacterized protein n=1 Tax=Mycobacterium bohemicum DSM 44277 TaxID=1236609 RepID=A0A0U0W961_MYCBE|nr:hypothetical protein BN971_02638 [Mycobacterium bohemicum DSM 44277]